MDFTPEMLEAELHKAAEPEFRAFTVRLQPGVTNCLGVRTPVVRQFAKDILKGPGALSFAEAALEAGESLSQEARIVTGLVIAGLPGIAFGGRLVLLERLLPLLDGWAVTDIIGTSCKVFARHPDEGFAFVKRCLADNRLWTVRFGLVLILSHYRSPERLREVLDAVAVPAVFRLAAGEYYLSMALAWALSVLYLTDAQAVLDWTVRHAKQGDLTPATVRRTAQKIRDSLRVTPEAKRNVTAVLGPYAKRSARNA